MTGTVWTVCLHIHAMKNRRVFACLLLAMYLLGALNLPAIAWQPIPSSGAPVVRKIEPPNWWTDFTPELTLLLTGDNFGGARVRSTTKHVTVLGSEASTNGHYLFVHIKIGAATQAGTAQLQLTTQSESTAVSIPLLKRTDSVGRFQGLSRDDIVYLIMPDRFADGDPSNDQPRNSTGSYDRRDLKAYHGGDIRGVRQHLGYLHDLGVTTLWLTPVWKNNDSDYHGYHVVDFYAIDDHMGSLTEYQGLVADAHKLGMKVLMDYVANHVGPNDIWANDPPTPTWLHGTPAHHLDPAYTFAGLVDPHASPRQYRATLEGWFAGKLPDLNPDDPKLGEYLAQNALWWVETAQLDGFRLDTFPYSSRKFWSQWHNRLHAIYPGVKTVGEVWDRDPEITSFFEGGRKQFDGVDTGLSTVFDFPLCFALRDVINRREPVQKLVDVLRQDSLYQHPDTLVTFFGNHDTKRFISEDGSNPAKLKAAFGLLLTLRGIPQIYAGDEIAMPGGDDPDNRRDFPGGFTGDQTKAFTAAGRLAEQQDVFTYVQSLLTLRKAHPALRSGKQLNIGWDESYYAFVRALPEEKLLVIYNNSSAARELAIPITDTLLDDTRRLEAIFGSSTATVTANKICINLRPNTISVFRTF